MAAATAEGNEALRKQLEEMKKEKAAATAEGNEKLRAQLEEMKAQALQTPGDNEVDASIRSEVAVRTSEDVPQPPPSPVTPLVAVELKSDKM